MNRLTESEMKKANMLASMISCSPHEWPNSLPEIQLICHGYLDCVADNQALRQHLAAVEAERDAARAEVAASLDSASAQASDAIIARIKEERQLQDRKWGGSTYDDKHSLGDWAHLIDQRTATLYRAPEHKVAKQELIEVAALAIAALESLWRNREGK